MKTVLWLCFVIELTVWRCLAEGRDEFQAKKKYFCGSGHKKSLILPKRTCTLLLTAMLCVWMSLQLFVCNNNMIIIIIITTVNNFSSTCIKRLHHFYLQWSGLFDWLMEYLHLRAGWKSLLITGGGLWRMITGILKMPMLCVGNWDFPQQR